MLGEAWVATSLILTHSLTDFGSNATEGNLYLSARPCGILRDRKRGTQYLCLIYSDRNYNTDFILNPVMRTG